MADVDNSMDILDSRDVIARLEELQNERASFASDIDDAETDVTFASHGDGDATGELTDTLDAAKAALVEWDESNAEELAALEALASEAADYAPDWPYGETLIRDSYWLEYAQQFADDIGAINSEASWPNNCIDWERAARELQMDYTAVDFDGVTYWIR